MKKFVLGAVVAAVLGFAVLVAVGAKTEQREQQHEVRE